MITAKQMKAARLFLDWDQRTLADAAGVSLPTIQRMETIGLERSSAGNVEKVQGALETAGVEFIPTGSYQGAGGAGVRLRDGR
ncbi:helix-turn-helix transcriptional regulator [Magnetospirillum sp. SS-4]|uniref:helix-turn-helix domain-containing protein n=1 Tax=Magnetospirillum sp. SS-4 TaxID=2681465 RepID=UPI001381027C|nr:helix-turn-helix transcriptional regulator [Magnetospirillum sp. SS-4]CAA7626647.1 conserved hypothetical protein [Magnetospirillum sp. SS-4]